MPGFDGQDAAGGRQVVFVGDLAGGAEVGRDADAFEDGGHGEEGSDSVEREGIGALGCGGRA